MTQTQQAKHTPGPWFISGAMNGETVRIVTDPESITAINGGDGYIATIKLPHAGMVEVHEPSREGANACLIAAAPELLAALKLVRDEYCEGGMLDGTPVEKAIVAAIAKAEGR